MQCGDDASIILNSPHYHYSYKFTPALSHHSCTQPSFISLIFHKKKVLRAPHNHTYIHTQQCTPYILFPDHEIRAAPVKALSRFLHVYTEACTRRLAASFLITYFFPSRRSPWLRREESSSGAFFFNVPLCTLPSTAGERSGERRRRRGERGWSVGKQIKLSRLYFLFRAIGKSSRPDSIRK